MPDREIYVLVVEDQLPLRIGLCEYLLDVGYIVFSSHDGEEALRLMDTEALDIGIIDIRLPGMDGNDLIVAAHRIQPTMRFLILTGSVEYSLPPFLEECGVRREDVFFKPLADLGVLAEAIDRIVAERKAE